MEEFISLSVPASIDTSLIERQVNASTGIWVASGPCLGCGRCRIGDGPDGPTLNFQCHGTGRHPKKRSNQILTVEAKMYKLLWVN